MSDYKKILLITGAAIQQLCSGLYAQTVEYKFSSVIDSIVRTDSFPWTYQQASWDYALIGDYEKSLKYYYKDGHIPRLNTHDKLEAGVLNNYKPQRADKIILEKAAKTKVIIINEAHHYPRHRVFVTALLPKLKALGYNFIGLEAYSQGLQFSDLKFPVKTDNFYLSEPCFGNLIREGLQLNYQFFSYEAGKDNSGKRLNNKEREIAQAENIQRIIQENPAGKFIIFCGFNHAAEDSTKDSWEFAMAGRLKQISGIDPLTIDQVELSESGTTEYENPFRQLIRLTYPAILTDKKGKPFNKASKKLVYDINIYHPDTKIKKGRPDWRISKNSKPVQVSERIEIDFPVMVKVYKETDDINKGVPIDITELKSKKDNTHIILNGGGKHIIIATNRKGERQQLVVD